MKIIQIVHMKAENYEWAGADCDQILALTDTGEIFVGSNNDQGILEWVCKLPPIPKKLGGPKTFRAKRGKIG